MKQGAKREAAQRAKREAAQRANQRAKRESGRLKGFSCQENAQAHTHAVKPDDSLGREPAAFAIERIEVMPDRIRCLVRVNTALSSASCARAKALSLARFPQLREHRCLNAEGRAFADEEFTTDVAHLFEHLAIELERIELERQAAKTGFPGFCGTTQPVDEKSGRWRVEINYTDDLVALSALREAAGFLEKALQEGA